MTAKGEQEMKHKVLSILFPLFFWLLVWQGIAMAVDANAAMGGELLLPSPVRVLTVLAGLAGEWPFWRSALLSLARMFFGILIGAVLGVGLAVLTAASRWCDLLFTPAVKVVRAVPVASFILLVLLWVRRDWVPVAISILMVLPVIWGSVRQGIGSADRRLLELCRCYRFDRAKILRLFWVPSVASAFASGLATAMGLAWKAGVAAEVLCQPRFAIGTQIYRTKLELATPDLFAWTLVVILLSLAMEWLVKYLLRKGRGA